VGQRIGAKGKQAMAQEHSGSCLCGDIRFHTTGLLREVIACHCRQCRHQSGHFYAATNVDDGRLHIDDPENRLTWYQSSPDARRGFCGNCGSALFWKMQGDPFTSILAGAFHEPTGLRLSRHIFVADKGDYYEIADNLPKHRQGSKSELIE
jgi:hypothetical protein